MKYVISFVTLLIAFLPTYAQPTKGLVKAVENGPKVLEEAQRATRSAFTLEAGAVGRLPHFQAPIDVPTVTSSLSSAVLATNLSQQVAHDMQRLRQVVSVSGDAGVYQLRSKLKRPIAYAKVSNISEIDRTRMVYQIIDGDLAQPGGLRQKYPDLEIEIPYILSEDISMLSAQIKQGIELKIEQLQQRKNNSHANLLDQQDGRVFVMSAVDTTGMNLGDLGMFEMEMKNIALEQADPTTFLQEEMYKKMVEYLDGQPMTLAEWKQVRGLIGDMNRAGFIHGDLGQNLFIKRNPETKKLKITLIDFEQLPWIRRTDEEILNRWENMLLRYHVLVP